MVQKDYCSNISFKDILKAIKIIPKAINLIKEVNKKGFKILLLFTILIGIGPILTLFGSQHLLNMLISKNFNKVFYAFLLLMLAELFNEIIVAINDYYHSKFQSLIAYKLNYNVMDKCTKLSLKHFEDSNIYDNLQRVQNETAYKPYQVFVDILSLITSIITLFSSILIILKWKPWIMLILIIIPIAFSINFFKIGKLEFNISWTRATEKRKSWYLSYILTRDSTFKEVKSYGLGKYILNKYKDLNEKFFKQDIGLARKRTLLTFFFEIIQQICAGFILLIIINSAFIGEILIGNVVGFIKALNLIQSNFKTILNNMYSIYESNLYINQLFEFLSIEEETSLQSKNKIKINKIDNLKINNLTFSYLNSKKNVLKDISLEIKNGERVAIVGANGSGKSTLVKLISKLYDINNKNILYNDIPSYNLDYEELRKCIAILFQDFTKYELSVRENIGFGEIDSIKDDKKINNAISKAKINFISDLDSQLGLWFQDGTQLSGGQWQKIAIARTFFRDASMYILDEPSSALDPISEKEIIDMFLDMTKDKIGIFISHRLSTAMLADKIIVMNDGEIIGIGTHKELLENNETYKNMYELESLSYTNI